MRTGALDDGHRWLRIVDPAWPDPLDASWAARHGGRWNPPGGHPTLYLNADRATARANVIRFLAGTPVEPEDLTDDSYSLVDVALPPDQVTIDAVTTDGLAALGLPATYPLDASGAELGDATCQPVGVAAYSAGHDGIHCRSAAAPARTDHRELAWFPRGRTAAPGRSRPFNAWYYDR